jgi:hypothetical protein
MSYGVWRAAKAGNLATVQRLVADDPGLLDATNGFDNVTPLMFAAQGGHVGVVRWLLDKGAALDERGSAGRTALWDACCGGRTPVVRLLLERGADPTTAQPSGSTALAAASSKGHLEVVRLLLGHPSAEATINHRDFLGRTALWDACDMGRKGIVRTLLEGGADPRIADNKGITPMAIAKELAAHPDAMAAHRGRQCVVELEVSFCLPLESSLKRIACLGVTVFIVGVVGGRRRSGPTCSGRPGRWPTSRRAARWRCRGGEGRRRRR